MHAMADEATRLRAAAGAAAADRDRLDRVAAVRRSLERAGTVARARRRRRSRRSRRRRVDFADADGRRRGDDGRRRRRRRRATPPEVSAEGDRVRVRFDDVDYGVWVGVARVRRGRAVGARDPRVGGRRAAPKASGRPRPGRRAARLDAGERRIGSAGFAILNAAEDRSFGRAGTRPSRARVVIATIVAAILIVAVVVIANAPANWLALLTRGPQRRRRCCSPMRRERSGPAPRWSRSRRRMPAGRPRTIETMCYEASGSRCPDASPGRSNGAVGWRRSCI